MASPPSGPPPNPDPTHPAAPCRRRALLDGVIRLSCRTDVQQDVRRVLGPVPPESLQAYSLAHELYGTTRMLLAVLEREQLAEVCQVGRAGWGRLLKAWLAGVGRRLPHPPLPAVQGLLLAVLEIGGLPDRLRLPFCGLLQQLAGGCSYQFGSPACGFLPWLTCKLISELGPGPLPPPHPRRLQGWRCDMWDVLAPVRAVRPVNGGPGWVLPRMAGLGSGGCGGAVGCLWGGQDRAGPPCRLSWAHSTPPPPLLSMAPSPPALPAALTRSWCSTCAPSTLRLREAGVCLLSNAPGAPAGTSAPTRRRRAVQPTGPPGKPLQRDLGVHMACAEPPDAPETNEAEECFEPFRRAGPGQLASAA